MNPLAIDLCGITLRNPVIAASGTFGYGLEFAPILDLSQLGALVTKGLSREPIAGNAAPRLWHTEGGMMNSVGLQNVGVAAFLRDKLPKLSAFDVPVIANVFGYREEDYEEVVRQLDAAPGLSAYELNISCPNTKEGGIFFSSDPAATASLVTRIARISRRPIIVKLSPNVAAIQPFARAVEASGAQAISLINTVIAYAVDPANGRSRIGNGFGGLSGPAIKPLALRLVYEAAQVVKIPVIGLGGISNGRDVMEFLQAGARAVQVGTATFIDPRAPALIAAQFARLKPMPVEPEPRQDEKVVPPLTKRQSEEAEDRTSVSAVVVHEAIRRDGEEELQRSVSALAWSGLSAGLSMGFSFVAQGLLRSHLPDQPWRPLITNLGYPLGFLLVVIGRQQLFTENTLTAIIPLLSERNFRTLVAVLRLWAVVLVANLVGAHIFAWAAADTTFLHPEVQTVLTGIAKEGAAVSFGSAIWRGIFAGWLIAMMVWMNAATNSSRVPHIIILTYIVSLAGLTHIIAGSIEVIYLVMIGERSEWAYLSGYMLPTLIGNCIGGVALVSALNHAQVVAGFDKRKK